MVGLLIAYKLYIQGLYRVMHHIVQNLPLTSQQKFRFGLFREFLHNLMCHHVLQPNGSESRVCKRSTAPRSA